jgi:hypothetical protein
VERAPSCAAAQPPSKTTTATATGTEALRADNTIHLTTATRHRHELTRSKTIRALRELDASGGAVTFEIVAKSAGVSRSWLYTQPDIRAEIERLRSLRHRAPAQAVPARQRTTDPSLLQRRKLANARNHELAEDNQRLRRQLAQLGELRAAGMWDTLRTDT